MLFFTCSTMKASGLPVRIITTATLLFFLAIALTPLPAHATISTLPSSDSFESPVGNWDNITGDNMDWTRKTGSTGSSGTGPSSAYDGSYYYYTESSSPNYPSKTAWLVGPTFDLTNYSSATFTFYYHMYGTSMGTLKVEASTNGTTWTSLWTKSGNQGNQWSLATGGLRQLCRQLGHRAVYRYHRELLHQRYGHRQGHHERGGSQVRLPAYSSRMLPPTAKALKAATAPGSMRAMMMTSTGQGTPAVPPPPVQALPRPMMATTTSIPNHRLNIPIRKPSCGARISLFHLPCPPPPCRSAIIWTATPWDTCTRGQYRCRYHLNRQIQQKRGPGRQLECGVHQPDYYLDDGVSLRLVGVTGTNISSDMAVDYMEISVGTVQTLAAPQVQQNHIHNTIPQTAAGTSGALTVGTVLRWPGQAGTDRAV